jgi:post-segregation antitoxin (ccd killing protein)
MPRKSVFTKTGDESTVRKMMVSVPEDVYKALRHKSVETEATMSEIVTQALRKHLGIKEGGDAPKK